jgi:hypothetical protein
VFGSGRKRVNIEFPMGTPLVHVAVETHHNAHSFNLTHTEADPAWKAGRILDDPAIMVITLR